MAIPSIPGNFIVQEDNGQVYVTWNIVTGATSYTLQRSTDGVTYTTIASPALNNYLDTAVLLNVQYFYQVAATNGSGTSPFTTPQSTIPTETGVMALGEIRLRAQQRADRVNSNFVTTAEWNSYINQSSFELYYLLVTEWEDYFLAPPVFLTTTGASSYLLPDGTLYNAAPPFYKMLGVDLAIGGGGPSNNQLGFITLQRFNWMERNKYVFPSLTANYLGVYNCQYKIMQNQLYLIPTLQANQNLRIWYIPRLNSMLKDTDVLDGISGWTEYVIVDAAIKALQKEESDTTVLMVQKQALLKRIEDSAMNRDAGSPATITNVNTPGMMNGNEWGGGYGF